MRIGIVGHFGGDKKFTDGQTVKTKEIYSFLVSQGFVVSVVDTFYSKKNPAKFFWDVKKLVDDNDVIILIVSSRGYKILSRCLVRANKRLKRKMFDFVIGGSRYRLFDADPKFKKAASRFTEIYVETARIKKEYERRGLNNVRVIPNFKKIKKFSAKDDFVKKGELHACIFSRVIKEKGIGDAIEAIKIANMDDGKKYFLDVYGKIGKGYEEEFANMVNGSEHVSYMGEVRPCESSAVISQYDVLLFPTYWESEGFPGTLIDAFFASVSVIATDWNDNFEILKEGKNAIKVRIKSPNDIANAMKRIAHSRKMLIEMSKSNHTKADEYTPKTAMRPFLKEIEYEK